MSADGRIRIDTAINNDKAKKDFKDFEDMAERAAERVKDSIDDMDTTKGVDKALKKNSQAFVKAQEMADDYKKKLDEVNEKMQEMETQALQDADIGFVTDTPKDIESRAEKTLFKNTDYDKLLQDAEKYEDLLMVQEETLKASASNIQELEGKMAELTLAEQEAVEHAKSLKEETSPISKNLEEAVNSSKRVENNLRSASKEAEKFGSCASRSASHAAKSLTKVGFAVLGVRTAYSLIQKATREVMSSNQELANQMSAIWSGLAAIIEPIISRIVGWITTLMSYIGAFIKLLTGVDIAAKANAKSMDKQKKSTNGVAKATKEANKQLAGFDEIQKLNSDNDSKSGGGGSGGGATGGLFPDLADLSVFDGLVKELERLAGIFKDGFKLGFGDSFKDLQRLNGYVKSIGKSLKEIWSDPAVNRAVRDFVDSTVFMLGSLVGSVASLGVTIATLIVGSIATYLERNINVIKKWLVEMFNVMTEINTILAYFFAAIAEIGRVFCSPTAVSIGGYLIESIVNGIGGAMLLLTKIGRDILNAIAKPIIDNKDIIISAVEATLVPIETLARTIAGAITHTFEKLNEAYDQYVKPTMDAIVDAFSHLMGVVLQLWIDYIAPVLDYIATGVEDLWNTYLQPIIDGVIDLIGKVIQAIGLIVVALEPLISFLLSILIPAVAAVIEYVWDVLSSVVEYIAKCIGSVIDILNGIMDFLIAVFTGDWEGAWQAIKDIAGAIWELIKNIALGGIEFVKDIVESILNLIKNIWNNVWTSIGDTVTRIWEVITNTVKEKIEGLKTVMANVMSSIKASWEGVWTSIKDFIGKIWDKILNFFNKGGKIFDGIVGSIADVFKTIVNALITGINKVIALPFNAINSAIQGIKSISIMGLKPFSFLGKITVPTIPKLARGGIVNNPGLGVNMGSYIAGEKGPEAVVPLTDSSFIADFAEEIAKHMGQDQVINLYIDGEKWYSWLKKRERKDLIMNGG